MSIKTAKTTATGLDPDLAATNRAFASAGPGEVLEWTAGRAQRPVITTNFRPMSIALIHLANAIIPGIPVIWIDHGFNTAETHTFVRQVTTRFELNLRIYRPQLHEATDPGSTASIPPLDTPAHRRFTERVKLEPFSRALDEWQPDVWITGIRADQTSFRQTLDVLSAGPQGVLRVAPFFHWTEVDVEGHIYDHGLPDYTRYTDPTKGTQERECGLQTLR